MAQSKLSPGLRHLFLHSKNVKAWLDLLSHRHVELVLDLRADTCCDSGGQLIRRILERVNHLLQLANHRVLALLLTLLPALHMGLQLLDIYRGKQTNSVRHSKICQAYSDVLLAQYKNQLKKKYSKCLSIHTKPTALNIDV